MGTLFKRALSGNSSKQAPSGNTSKQAPTVMYASDLSLSIVASAQTGDGASVDAGFSVNTPRLGNTGGVFSSAAVEVAPPAAVLVREADDSGLLEADDSGEIASAEDYGYFWRLCVDWLRIGFFYSEWQHKVVEYLRGERDRLVKQRAAGFRERVTVEIEGFVFELKPGGARHYGVVLISDGVEVRLCRRFPNVPEVQIEFSGRWFYDHSLYDTIHVARRLASFFGEPERDLVSRLDLRVDVPVELQEEHFLRFRGHGARCLGMYRDGRTGKLAAISTGRSEHRAFTVRVYNKRLEASDGAWLAWVKSFGVPDDVPVARVEVEFQRDELRKLGIDQAADLHDSERLRMAWRRVVYKYLYVVPLEDRSRRERSRVRVTDWWRRLQELGVSAEALCRDYQASDVTTHRLRVGVGCLAGEMVESGFAGAVGDVEALAASFVDLVHDGVREQVAELAAHIAKRVAEVVAQAVMARAEDRLRLLASTVQAAGLQYMSRKRRARRLYYVPSHVLN